MGKSGKNRSNRPTPPAVVAMDPAAQMLASGGYREEAVALNKAIHTHRETVKIKRDQQDPEKHLVDFTYDAYEPGRIILRFRSKRGSEGVMEEDLIPSITVECPQGFGNKFRQESGTGIDLSSYKVNVTEEYVLAIQTVVCAEDGTPPAFRLTLAVFDKDMENGECCVRATYESIQLNGIRYVLHQYGDFAKQHKVGNLLVFENKIG